MSLFEVEHLDLYYGRTQALKDVNIRIGERAITAFIGPSGCGKSTFLRVFNRMNDLIGNVSTTGRVTFGGKDLHTEYEPMELRRRIGMVFQKPNPFPMSIFDNVAYGPRLFRRYSRSDIADLVEKSLKKSALWEDVKDRLGKSALSLSGGQQQRLCIARTLATDPEVVLMDEPTSALDPISTARIEDLMVSLKEQYTIVVVTHNMQQASRISDDVAFFLVDDARCGFLVEYGKTRDLFLSPKDKRTEDYISGKFG